MEPNNITIIFFFHYCFHISNVEEERKHAKKIGETIVVCDVFHIDRSVFIPVAGVHHVTLPYDVCAFLFLLCSFFASTFRRNVWHVHFSEQLVYLAGSRYVR